MPRNGVNTATAIMPATNLFILYKRIGTTTYTYLIITVRTMTQDGDTMMIRTIARNDTVKRIKIKIIKADTTNVITKDVAMTNTGASRIKEITTGKDRIEVIIKEISSV